MVSLRTYFSSPVSLVERHRCDVKAIKDVQISRHISATGWAQLYGDNETLVDGINVTQAMRRIVVHFSWTSILVAQKYQVSPRRVHSSWVITRSNNKSADCNVVVLHTAQKRGEFLSSRHK